MPDAIEVFVPLLNPNEPEVRVSAVHVHEGQHVQAGEVLCSVETTKSTAEIAAERDGFVRGMAIAEGDQLRAGERICWLAERSDWRPAEAVESEVDQAGVPEGLRITRPARQLAEQSGLDLGLLPRGVLVTQETVRQHIFASDPRGIDLPPIKETSRALIVYGGGGHGKSLLELLQALGTYDVVGVVDDSLEPGSEVLGVPVIGSGAVLPGIVERGVHLAVNAVGGIGDVMSRVRIFERLREAGFDFPALAHPRAFLEPSAEIGPGAQVLPHAYVGTEVRLGFGSIVNTSAVVSHDCILEDYVNVAPGALLAGGVHLEERVLVGMGATINLGVRVGAGARIGNSAVVKQNVPAGGIVHAGSVWPPRT